MGKWLERLAVDSVYHEEAYILQHRDIESSKAWKIVKGRGSIDGDDDESGTSLSSTSNHHSKQMLLTLSSKYRKPSLSKLIDQRLWLKIYEDERYERDRSARSWKDICNCLFLLRHFLPLLSIFSMEFRGILDDDINKIHGTLKCFEKNIKEKKIYSSILSRMDKYIYLFGIKEKKKNKRKTL